MEYLPGYSKYKELVLTGGASGALTNHQLKIAVSYEAAMNGEFDDIRFTQADGITLIDAWAELIVTDTSATVWVEFPTTPANTVEQTYYMYYGNAGAASAWDCGRTFLLGDDFEGSSLDVIPTSGDVTVAADAGKYEAWPGIAKNAAGDLFVVYRTCDSNTHGYEATGRVVIRKSTNDGETWGSEVVVANAASPIDDRSGGGILIFDDSGTETILMAYFEMDASGNYVAYVIKSTDDGATWGSKIALSGSNRRAPGAGVPIMLSNGKILVPMYNSDTTVDTFVAESDDGGDTWTEYTVNTTYGSEFSIIETKTAGSYTGGVYGLIRDDSSPYVFKKVTSTDYGHTWSAASDETDFSDPYPTPITLHRAPDGNLLAAYTTNATDLLEIYESTDEGANWSRKTTCVSGASGSYYPIIETISSSELIVVWCTNLSTSDVYVNFVDYPLLDHRWVVDSGAVTVANSEVTLDGTDIIRNPVKLSLPLEWRAKVNFANTTDYMLFGMAEEPGNEWGTTPSQDSFSLQALITGKDYPTSYNDGVYTQNTTHTGTAGDHIYGVKWKSGEIKWYYDDVLIDTFTTNIPNEAIWAKFDNRTGTHKVDWITISKYVDGPPTYAFGNEEDVPTGGAWYYEMLRRRNS